MMHGDWFTVQVVYDGGADEKVTVLGRFKDHTRPTAIYPSRYELYSANEYRNACSIFGGLILLCAFGAYFTIEPPSLVTPLGIAGAGVVLMLFGYVVSLRKRRQLNARLQAGTQVIEPD